MLPGRSASADPWKLGADRWVDRAPYFSAEFVGPVVAILSKIVLSGLSRALRIEWPSPFLPGIPAEEGVFYGSMVVPADGNR